MNARAELELAKEIMSAAATAAVKECSPWAIASAARSIMSEYELKDQQQRRAKKKKAAEEEKEAQDKILLP